MSLFDDIVADLDAQVIGPDFGIEIIYYPRLAAPVTGLTLLLDENSAVTDEVGNIVEYRDQVTINRAQFQPKQGERFERADNGQRYTFEARITGDKKIENWQVKVCS